MNPPPDPLALQTQNAAAFAYIRDKVNQLLSIMGTLPLRPEELDDATLIELDPIGIVAGAFEQVLEHLKDTNRELALARQEIQGILDNLEAAVLVCRADGRLDDCNRQAREWFFDNLPLSELRGRPLSELCPRLDADTMLRQGERQEWLTHCAGRSYHVVTSPLPDEDGLPTRTILLFLDISRQLAAEANLRLYATVFGHLSEGVMITDAQARILQVNPALCRITGYAPGELLGQNPRLLNSGLHEPGFFAAMWDSLTRTGHWKGEIYNRAADGRVIPMLQSINAVYDEAGELSHYISVVSDITDLKETQTRLDHLAHHDALTGLPNRLLLNDRLAQAVARARRDAGRLALLFIDLDRFKTINDSLGHAVGDRLLVEVARRLEALTRRCDTIARLGGDEFVVIMEQLGAPEDATALAEKIGQVVRQPYQIQGKELHIGCSIGITLFPEDGLDAAALLKNADAAMYRAKDLGRDSHARYSPELSERAELRLDVETALRLAIRHKELQLHYQPMVEAKSGDIVGVEALVRWPTGPQGYNTPDVFIPMAEDSRLILPLGEWVLREALTRFRAWQDQGVALDYISVNISAAQLAYPGFAEMVAGLLVDLDVAGECLQLELTENVLMRDVGHGEKALLYLRRRGVRIAIDDFGTGYSSLAYLRQLPIDCLKIDRSFVRDIPRDPNDCAIAMAIIALAHTLGLKAVAEGIETQAQEGYLRQIGCDGLQGYRYARPLPEGELLLRLQRRV